MSTSNQSSFLSLSHLLYEKKVGIEIVRFAIEWYGIYVNDDSVAAMDNNFPDGSDVAKSAIALIDLFESSLVLGPTELPKSVFYEKGGNVLGWFERDFGDFIDRIKEEKNKNFRSLYYLLNKSKPINRSALIDEIESNGIFLSMKNVKTFYHVDRDSKMVAPSIQAIDQSIDSVHRQIGLGYVEPWVVEHPAIFEYGWPSDQVPEFPAVGLSTWFYGANSMKNLSSLYNDDLYTVGRIFIVKEVKPAVMKRVINNQGIFGFDEYGDLKRFSFDDEELTKFKDILKKYASLLITENSINLNFFDEEQFFRFGWPRGELPSFASVPKGYGLSEEENTPATNMAEKTASTNDNSNVDLEPEELLSSLSERQSYQAMIGGLIAFIQEKDRSVKQAHILRWIGKFIKIRGLKQTNRGKLYREGDAIYKEVKQLLADHNISLREDEPAQDLKPRGK